MDYFVKELSFTNFNYIFLFFFHNKMSDDGSNQSIDSRENSNFSPPLKTKSEANQHRFQSSAMNLVSSSKFFFFCCAITLPFNHVEHTASTIEKKSEREGKGSVKSKRIFTG